MHTIIIRTKRRQLRLYELLNSNSDDKDNAQPEPESITEEKEESVGYLSSYTALIVNNLQIYIDKVHIRYEDNLSNPKVRIH